MSAQHFPIFHSRFGDGTRHADVSEHALERFRAHLPEALYAFMREAGVSSYMDGFLWTLDPADYTPWLNAWWAEPKQVCVPFLRTALGDFIGVTKNVDESVPGVLITLVLVHRCELKHLIHRADWLFDKYLCNEGFLDSALNRALFTQTDIAERTLAPDECLGLEPGNLRAAPLRKCKLREYATLFASAGALRTVL